MCPPRLPQPHSCRIIAEHVRRSFHQLSGILRENNVAVRDDAPEPPFSAEGGSEDTRTAWHELQHSHAGELEAALTRVTHSEFFKLHSITTPTPIHSTARILSLEHKSANTISCLILFSL